nr:retrovirus-related Pol polyprotein from transposon TNT 1-94 [Tanacetum cinerariifolium]
MYLSRMSRVDGDAKPEFQWNPDERRVVVQDQRLKSIIVSCLPDDTMETVISCVSAKEIWTDLVHNFEGPSDTKENRIMDLKLKYQTFREKSTKSLSQTYTSYKTLLNEPANDGVNLSKHEINVGFVNSLPKKWLTFSKALRNANHTQTLDLADINGRFVYEDNLIQKKYSNTKKALITTPIDERSSEEYLRDLDVEYQERALLANSKHFIKRRNNFSGHKAYENNKCYKCGNKGHFARDCFSKTSNPSYQSPINNFSSVSKGFQPKFTPKLIQSSPNLNSQTNPKFQKDYKNKGLVAEIFVWDEEEVFDDEEFTQFKVLMALADDELTIEKSHARNSEWFNITIRKDGTIFNANKEIVLMAPRRNDVYVLDKSSLTPNEARFFAKASESINWLWHKRLSHLNFKNINKFSKQNKVLGLPSVVYSKDKPWTSCEKGKHHRASLKTKQNFSIRKCLHLLHMGLFGPIRMVENQNDVKVKQIRTDNGMEFRNHELESFCDEKENSQNFSSSYTPKQNGVAERKNRTLIEAARTMLNGLVLSKHLWTEADIPLSQRISESITQQQIEETYHVTFNESMEAIRFTNTSVDEIGIDDSSRYPPNEFLYEDDPSRQYQDIEDPLYLINTKGTHEQMITQPTDVQSGNNTKVLRPITEPLIPDVTQSHIPNQASTSMLTRSMAAKLTATLASECLFPDFLSKIEPTKVFEVFKNKKYEHGTTIKNKARLVTQGYSQEEEINYDETFSLVARMEAIRIFLAFATYMNFKVFQIDVKSAFLNDSDYVGCNMDRKSTSGACQILGGKLVCWSAKKQHDYDIHYKMVSIFCDNTNAIAISNNPILHSRTKHIDIRYHFIKDHILKGDIELHFIPIEYQLADIFTKPLDEPTFTKLKAKLGMLNID